MPPSLPPASTDGHCIRPVTAADLIVLKDVVAANDMFPPALLDGMIAPALSGDAPDDIWLTLDLAGSGPVAIAYVAPERMTEGTWNLYLIAVHPERHGQGWGTALMAVIEETVSRRAGRVLLVETSGLPEFARTRGFYTQSGYTQEAVIRDFYRAGEDKVVFWKALSAPTAVSP